MASRHCLIFLPNLLWNIHYDWPFVQLMHNIRASGRDVVLGPGEYFFQQTLLVNPLTAPIWLAGLFALLFSARLKPYRVLGWCYLVCYAVFFILHGKNYYLAPMYPMLLAAGAVMIEVVLDRPDGDRTGRGRPRLKWLKPVIVIVLLASGVHTGADRRSSFLARPISCIHEDTSLQTSGDGAFPCARRVAAVVRRPVWMAGDRGRNGGCVESACARGTR